MSDSTLLWRAVFLVLYPPKKKLMWNMLMI